MRAYVRGLHEIGRVDVGLVGGKGAALGELSRLDGVPVPDGFCVTTEAFARVVAETPAIRDAIDPLARMGADDHHAIRAASGAVRDALAAVPVPAEVEQAILGALARLGAHDAYAVRSSATAEDLPSASFAGQQDTFLNVVGGPAVLSRIRLCWASLFTERAIAYRLREGVDHARVHMAVVVQKMLRPQAAGVLFTADPLTGNRKVAAVEAVFGLGEPLVSGRVAADRYTVRDGRIVEKAVAPKRFATWAAEAGGTEDRPLPPDSADREVLTEEQVVRLVRLGGLIQRGFGHPQDLEWCLVDDVFHVVQSRPITTLYPVPETPEPGNRVYLSVGHQQMMTDAMRPLGLSLFQHIAARPMYAAGGRLFVDPTQQLASPGSRALLLDAVGRSDPLSRDALATLLDRDGFFGPVADAPAPPGPPKGAPGGGPPEIEDDPAIVTDLIARGQASIEALERDLRTKTGTELLDFLLQDFQVLKRALLEPRSFAVILAGMDAANWINDHVLEWVGEKQAADTLAQSAPNNVTSEMGLALLDVADVIRPHPEVIAWLRTANDDGFLDGLLPLEGGRAAHDALSAYLDRYGMRCVGEIDVTRTRWAEAPTLLVPLLLGNIRNFQPGEGRRRFERGRLEAARAEEELLARLRRTPDGERRAEETRRKVHRLRTFVGYREYPKYFLVRRIFVYKRALLEEAGRLVRAGVVREREDIYHLTVEELREVVRTGTLDDGLVSVRKAEHERHRRLSPPRVLTSDGEVVTGSYRRAGLPAHALVGLPVSAGVAEGRARVVADIADATIEPGDILVTAFTDPSWTPLFVSVGGLVTEVGGLMTHGAVIAREYGLPAVVGVEDATRRIPDGARVRVHGTDGYVEILP